MLDRIVEWSPILVKGGLSVLVLLSVYCGIFHTPWGRSLWEKERKFDKRGHKM